MSTHRLWWRQKRRRSTNSPSWLSSTIWSCPALPGFLLLMTMMIMLHILKLVNFDDNSEGRMFYHLILSCPARLLQLPRTYDHDHWSCYKMVVITLITIKPLCLSQYEADICLQASSLLCLSICLNSGLCSWWWGWRSGWIQKIFYS